jgi:hypothetical protein
MHLTSTTSFASVRTFQPASTQTKKKKLNELTGKLYKAVLRELCWKLRNLKQFREHISLFFLSAFSITAI